MWFRWECVCGSWEAGAPYCKAFKPSERSGAMVSMLNRSFDALIHPGGKMPAAGFRSNLLRFLFRLIALVRAAKNRNIPIKSH